MKSDCAKSDWKSLMFNVCKQGNLQNQVYDLSFYQTLHQNFKNQQNELYQAKKDNKNLLQSLIHENNTLKKDLSVIRKDYNKMKNKFQLEIDLLENDKFEKVQKILNLQENEKIIKKKFSKLEDESLILEEKYSNLLEENSKILKENEKENEKILKGTSLKLKPWMESLEKTKNDLTFSQKLNNSYKLKIKDLENEKKRHEKSINTLQKEVQDIKNLENLNETLEKENLENSRKIHDLHVELSKSKNKYKKTNLCSKIDLLNEEIIKLKDDITTINVNNNITLKFKNEEIYKLKSKSQSDHCRIIELEKTVEDYENLNQKEEIKKLTKGSRDKKLNICHHHRKEIEETIASKKETTDMVRKELNLRRTKQVSRGRQRKKKMFMYDFLQFFFGGIITIYLSYNARHRIFSFIFAVLK